MGLWDGVSVIAPQVCGIGGLYRRFGRPMRVGIGERESSFGMGVNQLIAASSPHEAWDWWVHRFIFGIGG